MTRSPEVIESTKYFRALHKGKTLFLSSSGKKTLKELDIEDGDTIAVGGVRLDGMPSKTSNVKPEAKKSNKKKPKNRGTKTKKSMSLPTPVMSGKNH